MTRGLKWNRKHQLSVYADDTNMIYVIIRTVKKNRETHQSLIRRRI